MSDTSGFAPATRKQASNIVETLAAAFIDEPALSWVLPDREERAKRLPGFFRSVVPGTLANGLTFCTPDAEAASLWRLPGRIHPQGLEMLFALPGFVRALGSGARRAQALSRSLRAHEPTYPYWYLQFVGVAPSGQGRGLGGGGVRVGLEKARAAGMPVYLETSKAANVEFYRHLGFELLEDWSVPDGGPPVWSMLWR